VEVTVQKKLEYSSPSLGGKVPGSKDGGLYGVGRFQEEAHNNGIVNPSLENTSLNPLKLFPGASFSVMFRFLWVSRIYRCRMTLFCRQKYDLEPNLILILLAASETHLQQGMLARSLAINKNAMVFLIDNLQIRRLIKRVANPDNRRERMIELTLNGGRIVAEVKANYPEIIRWGLHPLTDAQILQFGILLAQVIAGESLAKPPMPLVRAKKTKRIATPGVPR
jgi:DNA-binding MarR family transcriptional regulator